MFYPISHAARNFKYIALCVFGRYRNSNQLVYLVEKILNSTKLTFVSDMFDKLKIYLQIGVCIEYNIYRVGS